MGAVCKEKEAHPSKGCTSFFLAGSWFRLAETRENIVVKALFSKACICRLRKKHKTHIYS
jgi:hypothetical protein